ncbi:hypothetical protein BGX38DRAFT_1332271 [Terfezia claveryi]|nr:hypothetical protein BGX38DRAFT_1332271 [Terfezia claveryi]
MQSQFSSSSPVSPLTPSPSHRPSQRFFTSIPAANNYPPPPKFPPLTSSLRGGIQQPIPTHPIPAHTQQALRYPPETSTFTPPRSWNTCPPHSEYSMSEYSVNITSMKSSPKQYPPSSCSPSPPLSPPLAAAPPSLPLPITTTLTTSLYIHLGRRQPRARKKLSKLTYKGRSSTHLPPRDGTLPEANNPYNYHHQFNSSPALAPLPHTCGSEGEEIEEITPNPSSRSYLPKSLSSFALDGGKYGQVVSGEGTFIPRRSVTQGSSRAASPVSSIPTKQIYVQHSRGKRNLELLLALFREHNTIVRIVQWLRRADLYSLVTVSKQVREGILLPPMGIGLDGPAQEKKKLLENFNRVTDGDDTDNESDRSYQISPLSPISPLEIRVGSMIISPSLGIGNSVGPHTEHQESKPTSDVNLPDRPWNNSGEFITTDQAFEDGSPSAPDLALETEYADRLGRLVWLLTLTARCKTPHRQQQQGKEKLKFCVWCGECVCADCNISPYIPHSHRLRRLCFDCWRFSGSGRLNTGDPPILGSSTVRTSPPASPDEAAKARNLLCTCKQGDEWVCPDCETGGRPLELDEFENLAQSTNVERGHANSKCSCWVCGKKLGGGVSKWNTPAQGGMGYAGSRGEDIWRLCLWCGKRMMAQDG